MQKYVSRADDSCGLRLEDQRRAGNGRRQDTCVFPTVRTRRRRWLLLSVSGSDNFDTTYRAIGEF